MATIASHKSVEAPQQPKQPSRKSKRAWRKNVDISEIQAGLEEARAELSKGYDSTSTAPFGLKLTLTLSFI